jgi:hypothetical protein
MSFYPNRGSRMLSESHRRQLLEESGISPDVARERGYRTVKRRAELEEFPKWQRRLGLYVPIFSPDTVTQSCQLRPDRPRNPKLKYESPQGSRVVLDVHPRMREEVHAGSGDLFVVEGTKKADALVSLGAAVVALTGVWMAHVPKSNPKRLLPCWDHVRLPGRRVFVIFDSDWRRNDNVHDAQEYLVRALEERGADVRVAYLEDNPDGSKVGADDFLVAGGTVAELKALCRKFERQDVARIRLSKDEKLRAAVEDLERRWWSEEWKGRGGYTDRDVALKLIEAAARSGKIHPEGLRVCVSWGTLQVGAKVARRTLGKALSRLEERGFLYRDNEGRKPDKTGAFVLRAKVDQEGRGAAPEGHVTQELQTCDPGGLHLRGAPEVPRLRWSRPKWKPGRETRRKYRLGEISRLPEPRARIERLGKIRGAVVDALEVAGGTLTLAELCQALHRKRARDLRRRVLPMLAEYGIIEVGSDAVTLTASWSRGLKEARLVGGELQADRLAEARRRKNSRAYHRRHDAPVSQPSSAGLVAVRVSREKRREYLNGRAGEPAANTRTDAELVAMRGRIERLVREGMARRLAEQEVYGAAVSCTTRSDPPTGPPDVTRARKMPRMVDGVYVHGAVCECEWCAA